MSNGKRTIIDVDAGFDLDPSRPLISFSQKVINTQCASAHHHPRAQLIYCDQGVMKVEFATGVWIVGSLQAMWIPGDVVHQVYFPEHANLNSIFIAPSIASELSQTSFAFHIDDFCKSLILKITSFNNQSPLTVQQKRIQQVFLDELSLAKPSTTFLPLSNHPNIKKIAEALEESYEYKCPINYYADLCCVSTKTLSRLFRKELGLTFSEWILRYKLIKAVNLLGNNHSVKEVAFELGYENSSSFIYTFKKFFKVTPGSLTSGTKMSKSLMKPSYKFNGGSF
ncbi:helix-turn-helix domain-containing protein [Desertivirga brevis]|uniref:helix-turn-helix domain-containing protein n=1 Tax=Desertivirga brevis TaxID=2810310 RepID=UPI001A961AFB|nr:helix-turn-helix transcriptional regulator [Pedobacter sp. SYSU D00873]